MTLVDLVKEAAMDRLTALDAAFLYLESPRTPMHVGSLSVFEGGPLRDDEGRVRIEEVRAVLVERMPWVPRFSKRLAAPPLRLGLPVWVDDPDFDIRHHVKLAVVPAPGTIAQLHDLAAQLHMELLDRSRPLWELWLVDGLADGRVALIEKIHHALVDGVSGVDVATATLDPTPEVRHPGPWTWQPAAVPSPVELVRDALVGGLTRPVRSALRRLRDPGSLVASARRLRRSAGAAPLSALVGPRCSLNQSIGVTRTLDSVTLPLPAVKAVARARGAKVNDVMLSVVAGGLRRLFEDRGEPVEGLRPNAMVPVSLRTDDQRLGLGNLVSSMVVGLPVDVADAGARLEAVSAMTRHLKEHDQAALAASVLQGADMLGALLPTLLSPLVHHQPLVNVVVTNVPGPPLPLYMLGARMERCTPIVPLARNLDVSIGILSYDAEIVVGLYADASTCPDVGVLAEGIEKAFAELSAAVEEGSS